jgi:hypothetical protein
MISFNTVSYKGLPVRFLGGNLESGPMYSIDLSSISEHLSQLKFLPPSLKNANKNDNPCIVLLTEI